MLNTESCVAVFVKKMEVLYGARYSSPE